MAGGTASGTRFFAADGKLRGDIDVRWEVELLREESILAVFDTLAAACSSALDRAAWLEDVGTQPCQPQHQVSIVSVRPHGRVSSSRKHSGRHSSDDCVETPSGIDPASGDLYLCREDCALDRIGSSLSAGPTE